MAANTAKTAPAAAKAAKAAPAPVAPAAVAAPAANGLVWVNPQHTQGQKAATAALQSMAAQGAYIVRLPATTSKLQTLLSGIAGNAALVATLPALVGSNAGGWAAFNVGYLGGANASYAACAAQHGNKKAKANPAFAYALPCGTLLTAAGNVWAQPAANAPAHVVAAWQSATAAVAMAQKGGAMPAPAAA